VAEPADIQSRADELTAVLTELMPAEWQTASAAGDFDVIASMLDQMEKAARAGQYDLAESARLEAYALLEVGPEARLIVFAPQLKLDIEGLFWNGQSEHKGLAHLIAQQASFSDIRASRAALDAALAEAQTLLGDNSAPAAVATNAAIIVFREGLEAVLILASLMSSLKRGAELRYRRPLWIGALAAFVATIVTWIVARGVLIALARYGERLEAIVSLVAVGVLLLITNWFFHKVYWTGWIAGFHARKKRLIGGEAGLWIGLMILGFTSVYREGFESVLFLQALVLEGGTGVVLAGVALALLATALVGVITFKLQVNLPYKKMLIFTGVLIGGVLLVMVGNTVHVMQVVGWLPIHPIGGVTLPFWLGTWFGLYATWEGIALQIAAAMFVLGSYALAERRIHRPGSRRQAGPPFERNHLAAERAESAEVQEVSAPSASMW
jgi:high-affinity iron transporter